MSLLALGMINDRNYQDISIRNFVLPVKYSVYLIHNKNKQNKFTSTDVQKEFIKISGMKAPITVIEAALDIIVKENSLNRLDGSYSIVDMNKFNNDMAYSIKQCEAGIDTFLEAYMAYKNNQFSQIISKEMAISEIETFFLYLNKEYGLLDVDIDTLGYNNDLIIDKSSDVAKFILKIEKGQTAEDKNLLNLFYQYANAVASATILMIYNKTEKSNSKVFKDIRFYLDTKIILNTIGLYGYEEKTASDEFLTILKGLGAKLIILDVTKTEVIGVLTATLGSLSSHSDSIMNSSFVHSLRKTMNDSQIKNLIIEKKDYISKNKLEQHSPSVLLNKVSVINPNNDSYTGVINEDEIFDFINNEYNEKHHNNKDSKNSRSSDVVHDIKCLQQVYRDRNSQPLFDYSKDSSFFVTDNVPLCNAVDKWLKKEDDRDQLSLTKEYRTFIFEAWAYSNKSTESISKITSLAVAKSIINFSDEHMASVLKYARILANEDPAKEKDVENLFIMTHIDRLSMSRLSQHTNSLEDKYKELSLEANKILSENPTLKEELERKSKELANLETEIYILKNENPALKEELYGKDKKLFYLEKEIEILKANETKRIEQDNKNRKIFRGIAVCILVLIIGGIIIWYFNLFNNLWAWGSTLFSTVIAPVLVHWIALKLNNLKK